MHIRVSHVAETLKESIFVVKTSRFNSTSSRMLYLEGVQRYRRTVRCARMIWFTHCIAAVCYLHVKRNALAGPYILSTYSNSASIHHLTRITICTTDDTAAYGVCVCVNAWRDWMRLYCGISNALQVSY